jgi:uncharacterized membrane protein YfcA
MVVWGPAIQRGVARRREARATATVEAARASRTQAGANQTGVDRTDGAQASTAGTGKFDASPAGSGRALGHSIAHRIAIVGGVFVLGIYGGYFGAAQGVLLVGLLSVLTSETLQSITGVKNLLTTVVNALAAVTFMIVSWHSVDWKVVLLIAVGATLGGVAGARVGRRLSPVLMRTIIVIVGIAALVRLLFFS